jgi:uroporphyrin-III C-methyltransferase
VASSVAFLTARQRGGDALNRLEAIAAAVDTLVVLMPLGGLEATAARLARVLGDERPAALIAGASTAEQCAVIDDLAGIAAAARRLGVSAPATLVVGEVVRLQTSASMTERSEAAISARHTSRSGSLVSAPL